MDMGVLVRGERVVAVMLPIAIDRPYFYLTGDVIDPKRGDVVEVPLGPRLVLGVIWRVDAPCDVPPEKLKHVRRRVGVAPLPSDLLTFISWVSSYNLTYPGLFLRSVLRNPEALNDPVPEKIVTYRGGVPDKETPARRRVLDLCRDGLVRSRRVLAREAGVGSGVIDRLVDLGVLAVVDAEPVASFQSPCPDYAPPDLNEGQSVAAGDLRRLVSGRFSVTLLDGVTGSGKTEVYFEAIAAVLRQGRQALVLLPEIALTGQFLDRFKGRFGVSPVEWHSELTVRQRVIAWRAVHRNEARVVIGARSALYLPFSDLGLIVVDEEHEAAYKQEDAPCYHARDMAVKRGHLSGFPVILASATPSVETRFNVETGRYGQVTLPSRFGARVMPDVRVVDLRHAPAAKGRFLSAELIEAARGALSAGGQVLFFLNRRGYAPLTLCGACGHRFMCPDCSSWLVEHRSRGRLVCHHCGLGVPVPRSCPSCAVSDRLVACGPGVERVDEEVGLCFPDARRVILSSDFLCDLDSMRSCLDDIASGRYDVIIGTQLVAKGHHFPGVSLVGVVDGDLGLDHGDLRAAERSFQLLHQVVGRSGRGALAGQGLIQTHMPDHMVMKALVSGDRNAFYRAEIAAREAEELPPFGRLAALIVSASDRARARNAAQRLARIAPLVAGVRLLGPAEAPLAVVRGRSRFRLLARSARSFDLQAYLRDLLVAMGPLKDGVRVQVDVDPYNFL